VDEGRLRRGTLLEGGEPLEALAKMVVNAEKRYRAALRNHGKA
jgi:hypothetical protein